MPEELQEIDAQKFAKLLIEIEACLEAREWANGKSLIEAWEQCERGDWLLWLVGCMVGTEYWPTRQEIVLAACACAETALKYVPEGEDHPRLVIETTRKWVKGEATVEQIKAASAAAYIAVNGISYTYVTYLITDAVYSASATVYTNKIAFAAADAAWIAARIAGMDLLEVLKQHADIVRSIIKLPEGEKA